MALSVFLQSSRKLPALNSMALKLMQTQFKNNNNHLILTPMIARRFSGLNAPILNRKTFVAHNQQIGLQKRMISHSAIWTAEKLLSAALLGIIPVCIAFPNIITDNILATTLVLHMHWGVESVVVDYIRPSLVGNIIPPIARAIVYVISVFTLAGLIYFNYNDIGCGRAVHRLWAIKAH